MLFEQAQTSFEVIRLNHEQRRQEFGVPPSQLSSVRPAIPPGANMRELLDHVRCRGSLEAPSRDGTHEPTGRIPELVFGTHGEREDRRVDDDHFFAPARISASSALRSAMSAGSGIGRAERIAFAAARFLSSDTGNALSIASRTSAPTDARRARASAWSRR